MRRAMIMAVAALALGATGAIACRYTVRDIGFVDLRGAEYLLIVRGLASDDATDRLKRRLADSNVKLSWTAGEAADWQIAIQDRLGRERILAEAATDEPPVDVAAWTLERLFSPTLKRLANNATGTFAHLVLIEGEDEAANEAARGVMQEAQAALRRIEPLLPRPLQHPVQTVVVEASQRQAERVMLWSLGIDSPSAAEPVLAVVYGRGRLAGPAMSGDAIVLNETLAQLALVGESCECETDRAWLEERILPMPWDATLRQAAAESLGFDPESPLVQAEVVRIVSRGPSSAEPGDRVADGRDDIEQLLLGYGETELLPSAGRGDASLTDETIGDEASDLEPIVESVQATVQTGDGWDFDETSSTGTDQATAVADAESDEAEAGSLADSRDSRESGSVPATTVGQSAGSVASDAEPVVATKTTMDEPTQQDQAVGVPGSVIMTLVVLTGVMVAAFFWIVLGGSKA